MATCLKGWSSIPERGNIFLPPVSLLCPDQYRCRPSLLFSECGDSLLSGVGLAQRLSMSGILHLCVLKPSWSGSCAHSLLSLLSAPVSDLPTKILCPVPVRATCPSCHSLLHHSNRMVHVQYVFACWMNLTSTISGVQMKVKLCLCTSWKHMGKWRCSSSRS